MIVWGGIASGQWAWSDGAEYSPSEDHWGRLDPAPLVGRFGHSAIWTGAEMLIWGGLNGYDREPLTRGVAYYRYGVIWRGNLDLPNY